MNATKIKEHAERIAALIGQIDDIKVEMTAALEIAKEQGINTKNLMKVAKELVMDSGKLQRRLDDQDQLDMFRQDVGLLKRKGLAA